MNSLMFKLRKKIKLLYMYEWLYDIFLGTALKKTREYAADFINKAHLFPTLDLCCGTGAQCRDIPKDNALGADIDLKVLEFAKSRMPDVAFICADGVDLPFKQNQFQCVVLAYALHEKSPKVRHAMVREVQRILKNDGKLIIIDYENPIDFQSRLGRIWTYIIERNAGKEHFQNGQEFLKQGGLRKFLLKYKIKVLKSHWLKLGSSRLVVGEFKT
ncbi:MAG: methyltransferase domain-containing protein [Candidatus Aminicenantes bacterium]|nr:methyltransferase domain-containing protein [Candidatus Aminicenantes bacterium]